MITSDNVNENAPRPMQLDVTAIDLAIIPDDTGADFLIMRMIEASGLIFDVPMKRDQVAAFANSLMGYAG